MAVQDNDVPEENKWDGKTTTQPASGSGAKDDPYLIGTGAELAWFADQVKNGSVALCARLTAEIDLNGHPSVLPPRAIKACLTGATAPSTDCIYPIKAMRVCSV